MKVSSLAWGLLFGMALTGPAPAQPVPQNPNCPVNANAAEAAQDYMQMHQIEADFHQAATDHNMDLTTSHGRLMLTVLGRLAEFERDLIRKRTTEGRGRAKARGVRLGRRPKLTVHQQREAIKRRENGEPIRDIARSYNVHNSTISRISA